MKCRSDMAVSIECQLDGAVTEQVLDDLRVRACFQQHAGGAVSKVVYPDTGQARMMQRLRERPIDHARANSVTMSVGEDQAGLQPSLADAPDLRLVLPLLFQRSEREPRKVDGSPTLLRLRRAQDEAGSGLPLKRVPNRESSCVQIDVAPEKPQRLSDPQTAGAEQDPERIPSTAVGQAE